MAEEEQAFSTLLERGVKYFEEVFIPILASYFIIMISKLFVIDSLRLFKILKRKVEASSLAIEHFFFTTLWDFLLI